MNKLAFSNFPVYQLFWNTAYTSFNELPLLMAGLSLPFPVFLFISISSLFPFHDTSSFLTTPFSSSILLFDSLFTYSHIHHSHHLISSSSCLRKVRVLPTIRGKRLLLMNHPWRLKRRRVSPFQIRPFQVEGGELWSSQWMPSYHRSLVQYPFTLSSGARWLFTSSGRPCLAIPRTVCFWHLLGSIVFLHPRSHYLLWKDLTRSYSLRIWVGYVIGLERMGG